MPDTVVIADDITGANDIGVMYAKAGWSAAVYGYEQLTEAADDASDVIIIDTDSRFLVPEEAYERVKQAVLVMNQKPVRQWIDKQCSVFRGNIGAEFDAMLDALEKEYAIVVLGFPDNGRTTLHGVHYVHGVELAKSQFQNDPVHPMHQSDLTKILCSQTCRKVHSLNYEQISQGAGHVKQLLEEWRRGGGYVIADVRDNADLLVLAEALKDEPIICGSSALSYYLASIQEKSQCSSCFPQNSPKDAIGKILGIAGSLTPQTIAQTAYLYKQGYPCMELNTHMLWDAKKRQQELTRILSWARQSYEKSSFVMIHSMNQEEQVEETKQLAEQLGMDNTRISSMVSDALAELAETIAKDEQVSALIICGGDTSATVCRKMSIGGMRVQKEIEPGLPTCESIRSPHYRMVLKSGSFGTEGFIEKAIRKLEEE